jgi:hypothetical protein
MADRKTRHKVRRSSSYAGYNGIKHRHFHPQQLGQLMGAQIRGTASTSSPVSYAVVY